MHGVYLSPERKKSRNASLDALRFLLFIANLMYIIFLYICTMEIEFRSIIHSGLMVGVLCYPPERDFSYNEVSIYLLIISVHIRWY